MCRGEGVKEKDIGSHTAAHVFNHPDQEKQEGEGAEHLSWPCLDLDYSGHVCARGAGPG